MPDRQTQLKAILGLLDSSVTKSEMADAFKKLLQFVKDIKDKNDREWSVIRMAFSKLEGEVKADTQKDVKDTVEASKKEVVAYFKPLMDKMLAEHDRKMSLMDEKMDSVQDGKDADEEKIVQGVLAKIPPPQLDTADDIRNKLEILQEDDRLDKAAIRGIDTLETRVQRLELRPSGKGGGGKGIGLYIGGKKKLLTANTINLIAGSGVTIAYAFTDGRNDITISSSAGGVTIETPTGTVDGTNTTFTPTSKPKFVVSDGTTYFENAGYTWDGTNITMSVAPSQYIRDAI